MFVIIMFMFETIDRTILCIQTHTHAQAHIVCIITSMFIFSPQCVLCTTHTECTILDIHQVSILLCVIVHAFSVNRRVSMADTWFRRDKKQAQEAHEDPLSASATDFVFDVNNAKICIKLFHYYFYYG